MTNMLAYIPVFVLIELFKRTSHRKSKSKRLQKVLKNIRGKAQETFETKSKKDSIKINQRRVFSFPWWLKIILYVVSYFCMALSICFVIFKGKNVYRYGC
jgi:hypothetical protein